MNTQWEYQEVVACSWSHEQTWFETNSFTDAQVRLNVWINNQQRIQNELQKHFDLGWEPIGEVGPSCLILNHYTHSYWGWALILALTWVGILFVLLCFPKRTEPVEFRIGMRRATSAQAPEKPSGDLRMQH